MPDRDPLRHIPPKAVPSSIDADIGSVLKEARLKKGQAVDVVSQHTRVPKKLISAMEGNRLDEFPAMVYLRGFLKIYCDYLDVDFEPLWKKINPDRPAAAPEASAPGAAAPAGKVPSAESAQAAAEEAAGGRKPAALFALILAGGVLAVWLLVRRPAPEAPAPSESPVPPPILQPINAPVEPLVTLAFKSDVWVRVTVDDKVRFEGMVPANGKPLEYKPKLKVSIRTSSPSDLILSLNGSATTFPAADPSGEHILLVR
ncbi:MAG: DUF4115 domain-containing protein [Elusimicrobia bacterium]|nr:DUF4115 domain-containing protein [Elusimicrobiota bacterium]